MRRNSIIAGLGLLIFAGIGEMVSGSGCDMTVDLAHLTDGKCPAGEKLCNDQCVSVRDPQVGCAQDSCVPCTPAHAVANCDSAGQCAIAACVGRFKDCNGRAADGCEIDIQHDALHCGSCEAPACIMPNATPDCGAGTCAIRSCNDGFDDCNDDASDGCEANLATDAMNCSRCHNPCPLGKRCQARQCN